MNEQISTRNWTWAVSNSISLKPNSKPSKQNLTRHQPLNISKILRLEQLNHQLTTNNKSWMKFELVTTYGSIILKTWTRRTHKFRRSNVAADNHRYTRNARALNPDEIEQAFKRPKKKHNETKPLVQGGYFWEGRMQTHSIGQGLPLVTTSLANLRFTKPEASEAINSQPSQANFESNDESAEETTLTTETCLTLGCFSL